MSGLEIIGIIIALGFVSMVEICAIVTCVSKTVDQKMRTRCDLELKIFKEEMDYLDKMLKPAVDLIASAIKTESPKETPEQ